MLKGLARNFAPILGRQLAAKCGFQISQSDVTSVPIKDRHQKSEEAREAPAEPAREKRNHPGREAQPNPFQPVTKPFPPPTHGAFYTRTDASGQCENVCSALNSPRAVALSFRAESRNL